MIVQTVSLPSVIALLGYCFVLIYSTTVIIEVLYLDFVWATFGRNRCRCTIIKEKIATVLLMQTMWGMSASTFILEYFITITIIDWYTSLQFAYTGPYGEPFSHWVCSINSNNTRCRWHTSITTSRDHLYLPGGRESACLLAKLFTCTRLSFASIQDVCVQNHLRNFTCGGHVSAKARGHKGSS